MSQALKERLKNYIIIMLILTGIAQVGILFGYQNQGTPTNFIMGLFGNTGRISDNAARDMLFAPDRIIMSGGDTYIQNSQAGQQILQGFMGGDKKGCFKYYFR